MLSPGEVTDTEQEILDAARRVCQRCGTDGARMKDIAEEAGVNKALLHYYFRSKENLTREVFKESFEELFPRIAGALSGDAPLEEKVEQVVEEYTEFFLENPFLPGYVVCEMNHHTERMRETVAQMAHKKDPVSDQLARQLSERADAGDISPIDPEQFVVNLVSLCIFPFMSRPMFDVMLGIEEERFESFIQKRKETLPEFIMSALRP